MDGNLMNRLSVSGNLLLFVDENENQKYLIHIIINNIFAVLGGL